jgi:hypothetical protein
MPKALYIAAILAISLSTLAEAIPVCSNYVPLGGNDICQLGIILGSIL